MTKVILDIPKIKQLPNHCVPASLAMVLRYYGQDNTQEEIAEWFDSNVYEDGVFYYELLPSIRAHGFIAHPRQKIGLEGIMRTIDKGIPLLAVVRQRICGNGEGDQTHTIVVRGYETNPNIVWFNDPYVLSRDKMLYGNFNREWKNIRKNGDYYNQYGIAIRKELFQ